MVRIAFASCVFYAYNIYITALHGDLILHKEKRLFFEGCLVCVLKPTCYLAYCKNPKEPEKYWKILKNAEL